MSYMGLFWETGMPEAWALSRSSIEKPEANLTGGSLLDAGMMAQLWSQNELDDGTGPFIPDPAHMVPGDNAGRPVPTPGGKKTKKG